MATEERAVNTAKRLGRQAGDSKKPTKAKSARRKPTKKTTQKFDQIIFRDWCKACGICSAFCPKNVIGRDASGAPVIERPDDCIGCRFCELHCPDFAITIRERKESNETT
jgi:2-oxoglutarate ferredoxin oxidoreductase subunit delta